MFFFEMDLIFAVEDQKASPEISDLYDKIYVISLDRTPERYAYVKKQFDKQGLKCERFSAVDGNLITVRDQRENVIVPWQEIGPPKGYYRGAILEIGYPFYKDAEFCYITDRCLLRTGELGCAMSHRAVWADVVRNRYKKVVIFEDDVTLLDGFRQNFSKIMKNLPNDFDIFFLDIAVRPHELGDTYFLQPNFWLSKFFNTQSYYYAKLRLCNKDITSTHAYVITYESAKNLLKKTKVIHVPIDTSIMFSGLNLYISKVKILTSNLNNSVIFNRKGNKK